MTTKNRKRNVKTKKHISCCRHTPKDRTCARSTDNKLFTLPRKWTRKQCLNVHNKGFSMRSSCAPYMGCKMNY